MLAHKVEGMENITGKHDHVNYGATSGVIYTFPKFASVGKTAGGAEDRRHGIQRRNTGEMILEGVIGIEYGAASEDLPHTCHAHPTLSETFKEACLAPFDKPSNF
ncbi:unnamed protein product [Peronospora destructor]|uniref:Pyridine nucleotide-disulphide oxidoreductase dimerisation domain-containing protein n=1 Tax=Peronospora destructor TaxID=86335 RepID=A0AAV0T0E7_9STRA|nr:unnamed protein product [Peronospora destructor]